MIAIGHTSTGVIIGVASAVILPESLPISVQVTLCGIIGLASHYIMDLVPHGHYEIDQANPTPHSLSKLALDLAVPICLLGLYLLTTHGFDRFSWLIGAGVFGAQLPDIINGLRSQNKLPKWGWLQKEGNFHSNTHWHNPTDKSKATAEGGRRLGLSDIWQAVVISVSITLLLVY